MTKHSSKFCFVLFFLSFTPIILHQHVSKEQQPSHTNTHQQSLRKGRNGKKKELGSLVSSAVRRPLTRCCCCPLSEQLRNQPHAETK